MEHSEQQCPAALWEFLEWGSSGSESLVVKLSQ